MPAIREHPSILLAQLLSFPSITPDDAGAMDWLIAYLEDLGFRCTELNCNTSSGVLVRNLYAEWGFGKPHLCFAGHLDVVPSGEESQWHFPPFAGVIAEGKVWGRGAVDMKGAIACFLSAVVDFIANHPKGKISLLITCNEEGDGHGGTEYAIRQLPSLGVIIDDCLVGEPTSVHSIGDTIKLGRRGSMNCHLQIIGKQGHVAYPHLAVNPINEMIAVLSELSRRPLDPGDENFPASQLVITSIDVGNSISNIIPQKISAKFNIRFNPLHSSQSLQAMVNSICQANIVDSKYELTCNTGSHPFLSNKGKLFDVLPLAVQQITGELPQSSTDGGTSDARFIKDLCPVVELGLCNSLAHQIDEAVSILELERLQAIYYQVLINYFTHL